MQLYDKSHRKTGMSMHSYHGGRRFLSHLPCNHWAHPRQSTPPETDSFPGPVHIDNYVYMYALAIDSLRIEPSIL